MVAVITAVLAGSAGGLLAGVASGHSLVAAPVACVVVAAAVLTGLMRYQSSAWIRGSTASMFLGAEEGHTEPAWTQRAICRAPAVSRMAQREALRCPRDGPEDRPGALVERGVARRG
jgi:hypothetical protein